MERILGLDLGSNSIGWAIVDIEEKKIIDMGCRIFPMGVNLEKGTKEVSKNATRRMKRQIRRQLTRRRYRKLYLIKLLMKHGMFPSVSNLKEELTRLRLSPALKEFFSINPYEARSKAYNGDKLSLFEIGRIMYQFSQRRGYKETSLEAPDDEGKIYEGNPAEGKTGINETKVKAAKFGTLGNYLYNEDPLKTRLRNRYTTRGMYVDEFNKIYGTFSRYYPDIFTEEMKLRLGDPKKGILFSQRELRTQKYLVGKCTFEPKKTRCPLSNIVFEKFRALQFINTIRAGDEPLNTAQRNTVFELLESKDTLKFKDIRKKLKAENIIFNYPDEQSVTGCKTINSFRKIFGKDEWSAMGQEKQEEIWNTVYSAWSKDWLEKHAREKWGFDEAGIKKILKKPTQGYSSLSRKAIGLILPFLEKGYIYSDAVALAGTVNALGDKWSAMSSDERSFLEDTAYSVIKDKSLKAPVTERLKVFLAEQYKLGEKELSRLYHHSVDPDEGARSELLVEPENTRNPVVQQVLFETRTLVNSIIKKYGKPDRIVVELARDVKNSKDKRAQFIFDNRKNEEINSSAKKVLDEYDLPHTRTNVQRVVLWKECGGICPYTGKTIGIKNLFDDGYVQVEHIVPYSVCLNDGMQNKTLCLAEENQRKGDRTPFQFYGGDSEKWEQIRQQAWSAFGSTNYPKYKRFTSKEIPDAGEFISRQLNDTRYISRVAAKYLKPVTDDVVVTQGTATSLLRHLWGLDSILNSTFETGGFEDGEYIAARDKNGKLTELVKWNYDTYAEDVKRLESKGKVLQGHIEGGRFYPYKTRDDHRHHAVDALTISLTDRSVIQKIASLSARGNNISGEAGKASLPWEGFRNDAGQAVSSILVSHKKRNKINTLVIKKLYTPDGRPMKNKNGEHISARTQAPRAQMHEETFFGKHRGDDGDEYFHTTKQLSYFTSVKQLEKIADAGVRKVLLQHLEKNGINIENKNQAVPKNAFFSYDESGRPVPLVFLPNRNGKPVPVKKVRIREVKRNAVALGGSNNKWVEPGNNDHLAVYVSPEGKYEFRVVTFIEAVRRKSEGKTVVDVNPADGSEFVASFKENDMYVCGLTPEEFEQHRSDYEFLSNYLYRVQKISTSGYRIMFRKHNAATLGDKAEEFNIASETAYPAANPVKVRISQIGKIEKIY